MIVVVQRFDQAGLHQVQKLRYTAKDWSYIPYGYGKKLVVG